MKKFEKQMIKAQRRLDKLKKQAERIKAHTVREDTSRKPQIGDICKFWDDDGSFGVGILDNINEEEVYSYYSSNISESFKHCEILDPNMTLGEVFGKGVNND